MAGSRLVTIDLDAGKHVSPSIDWSGESIVNDLAISPDALYTSGQVITDGESNAAGSIRAERRDLETGEVTARSAIGFDEVAFSGGRLIMASTSGRIVEADPVTMEPIGAPFPGCDRTRPGVQRRR
jgi:hypothetical protein